MLDSVAANRNQNGSGVTMIEDRRVWSQLLFVFAAAVIVATSLFVSKKLVDKVADEERLKMEIWAMSARQLAAEEADGDQALDLILKIIESNKTIPAILCNERDSIVSYNNISVSGSDSVAQLQGKLADFREGYPAIVIDMGPEGLQYLYYSDSSTLRQILLFPYVQLAVILLFIFLAIRAVLATKRAEQNRIWAGLSKETAHQLGTPISSLMAWTELLRMGQLSPEIVAEIEKDTHRLQMIADRFQKVGSASVTSSVDLSQVLRQTIDYMQPRISKQVSVDLQLPEQTVMIAGSETLLSWVIENLLKNAVDAMQGKGRVVLSLKQKGRNAVIDFSDTGKGIAKSKLRMIFRPGYTTRERGWGLGLSLAKRIVEEYHAGQIFVLRSEIGVGTTFRILLPLIKSVVEE
ncbi:sensor histidine kinase [Porphyromonas crevioricanis]|nr:HAMP domain-containing sensor histidine kinase [Porphyromonas crevioricanis]